MTAEINDRAGDTPGPVQVPLSALEHFDYCPRQAGLILLEDGYADDTATIRGTILHQHVHEPGEEVRDGVRLLRALPVWHDGLGLTGVCDVVEIREDGSVIPIEHKSGEYHPSGPADVQLAGQAMCLEAMFRTHIPVGMIYAASDRRRHQVHVSEKLRQRVVASAASVREILGQETLPPALSDRRCRRCSINHACMPGVLVGQSAFAKAAASLFTATRETDAEWDD
jgi:CRISPR-associated exonuclease Cas4